MEDTLLHIAGEALKNVLILSAPTVLTALGVGFLISLFQAVTQIQEQTLTFVPKIIAVFLVILVTGGAMISSISEFTHTTWEDAAAELRK